MLARLFPDRFVPVLLATIVVAIWEKECDLATLRRELDRGPTGVAAAVAEAETVVAMPGELSPAA